VAELESKPSPPEMEGIDSLFVNTFDYGIELMIYLSPFAILVNYRALENEYKLWEQNRTLTCRKPFLTVR